MKQRKRILAFLLSVSLLIACFTAFSFAADTPTEMTVSELAAASGAVRTAVNAAILSGSKDANGVYKDIVAPATITVGDYAMGIEDYTLMAAQAIVLISQGKAANTQIAYQEVGTTDRNAIGDAITTINAGQILNLAERVANYGGTMGELATSHNRPTDGTNIFQGRICIFTIAEAFAATLENYANTGALATSVTITPSSYTTSATTDPDAPTITPDPETQDWYAATIAAATEIKEYVLANEDLPSSITFMGQKITMGQFQYLATQAVVGINGGTTSGTLKLMDVVDAPNPSEALSPGNVQLADYVVMAERIVTFIEANGAGPNYSTAALGQVNYKECVYMYAKILAYYGENGQLPSYCSVTYWSVTNGTFVEGGATFGADYSAYAAYIVPTTYCQSTNATIISVAQIGMNYDGGKSWGSTPTNTYQAMWNLFEYLNDKTVYSLYANSSRGATGVWRDKKGNCCDMAHLFNACARSLGVPGRYRHGYCVFQSGYRDGHVWAEAYCGSSYGWMTADLVSDYNYLGYKTSSTSYWLSGDKTITLPF